MSKLHIDFGSENPNAVASDHDLLATSQAAMPNGVEKGEALDDCIEILHDVSDEDLPIERQLELVDMNDEDMDMLEWIVRKIIPIPKQYYWESTTTSRSTDASNLPRSVVIWHNVVGTLSRAVQWIDRMGTPVADATGLTSSRFDYVLSTMTDEQKKIAAQTARDRKIKKMESRHASAKSVMMEAEEETEGGGIA